MFKFLKLMLKAERPAVPTAEPNPRITLETDHALQTEAALHHHEQIGAGQFDL